MSIRRLWPIAGLGLCLVPLLSGCGEVSSDMAPVNSDLHGSVHLPIGACTVNFEATVRSGPSAGTDLVGYAVFQADASGALHDSEMHTVDGRTVPIHGTARDGQLELQFDLGAGQTITGTGTMHGGLNGCRGEMRGPLTGPMPGDTGDWLGGDGQVILVNETGQIPLNEIGSTPVPTDAGVVRVDASSPIPDAGSSGADAAQTQGQALVTPDGALFLAVPSQHVILRADHALESDFVVWAGARNQAGSADGSRLNARFRSPTSITYDAARGAMVVADTGNNTIRRVLMANNQVSTVAGVSSINSASLSAGFGALTQFASRGVVAATNGVYFVTDASNHCLWRMNATTFQMTLIAGRPGTPGNQDGIGSMARFNTPGEVHVSNTNDIVTLAQIDCRLRIIQIPPGLVSTIGVPSGCQ